MTTALHAALGFSGSELTVDLVRQACELKLAESDQLDWKRDLPLPKKGNGVDDEQIRARALELAKDIAAMANGRGGVLVYGVQEEQGGVAGAVISVGDLADGEQARRIRQVAYNLIYPPILVACHSLVDDDVQVLVVEVAESDDAPHLVQPRRDGGNDGWLMAPYRSGPDTQNMVEKQIEAAYRQRFQGRGQRDRRLRELVEDLSARCVSESDRKTGTLLVVAQPVRPRRGPLPGPDPAREAFGLQQAAAAFADRLARNIVGPNHFPVALMHRVVNPRRGVRRHIFVATRDLRSSTGDTIGKPTELRLELHDDGSIGFAWRAGGAFSNLGRADEHPRTPGLAADDVGAVAILILALVHTLNEELDLKTDYQVRVEFTPQTPLYVSPERSGFDEDDIKVPAPAPLEAELRLNAGPDIRAADFLAFGQDLSNSFELHRTPLEAFWELPTNSQPNHPVRELARQLLGGEPDHPVTGRSLV